MDGVLIDQNRLLTCGILFAGILATGAALGLLGKPYNGLLFNAHKLIALAAVILIGISASQWLRGFSLSAPLIAVLVVGVICVLVLFVSGALLSAGKLNPSGLLIAHRVGTGGIVLAILVLIYQFWKGLAV